MELTSKDISRQEFTAARGLHSALFERVMVNLPRQSKVLDIGCGAGAWLERLGEAGFTDLTGIDKDISKSRGVPARLVEMDTDFEFRQLDVTSFDLISAIEVVEHVQNPGSFVRFIATHLAPHGQAILTTPNVQSLPCRLGFLVKGALPNFDEKGEPTHIYPLLLDAFTKILNEHGLEVRSTWGYPYKGTQLYRKATVSLAHALGMFCRDDVPGDVLCMSITHKLS